MLVSVGITKLCESTTPISPVPERATGYYERTFRFHSNRLLHGGQPSPSEGLGRNRNQKSGRSEGKLGWHLFQDRAPRSVSLVARHIPCRRSSYSTFGLIILKVCPSFSHNIPSCSESDGILDFFLHVGQSLIRSSGKNIWRKSYCPHHTHSLSYKSLLRTWRSRLL